MENGEVFSFWMNSEGRSGTPMGDMSVYPGDTPQTVSGYNKTYSYDRRMAVNASASWTGYHSRTPSRNPSWGATGSPAASR